MAFSIFASRNQRELRDEARFRNMLETRKLRPQIFFDTSGVIDMLLGFEGMAQGGKIRWDNFGRPSTLVYAMAYQKWLGTIHLLPPHTEELIDVLQKEKFKSPNLRDANLYEEFWNQIHQELSFLSQSTGNQSIRERLSRMKMDSLKAFKALYLHEAQSDWRSRYKYLVREKMVLNLSDESYKTKEVTSNPLFYPLLKFLNEKRSNRSSNNYIDAVALCLLDEKLRTSKGKGYQIPVYYSYQDHILEAVAYFSKNETSKPFTYIHPQEGDFLIVRNADYFLIEGLKAAALNGASSKEWWLPFENALLYFDPHHSLDENLQQEIQKAFDEKALLEFFDHWWNADGLQKLAIALQEPINNIADQEEVERYINEERKRLTQKFEPVSKRIDLIKKVWDVLGSLPKSIKERFPSENHYPNVYKEFGPRFSFREELCKVAQNWVDTLCHSVNDPENPNKWSVENAVASDLLSALFEDESFDQETLEKLIRALAFLWAFEKYGLINYVCNIVREKYEKKTPNSKRDDYDKYPNAYLALLHAGAILRENSKDCQQRALQIIQCLSRKFPNNYKAWAGLAYLYYLLWQRNNVAQDAPEIYAGNTLQNMAPNAKEFLLQASLHCKKTIDYIEKLLKDDDDPDKVKERHRKYYYVVNTHLFFETIKAEPKQFLSEMPFYANKLIDIVGDRDYWQAARFDDTLSRYYFRMAKLADTQIKFDTYMRRATEFNQRALQESQATDGIYKTLQIKLEDALAVGFQIHKDDQLPVI